MHALGAFHEHNRSDREDHITIVWNNIPETWKDQFKKNAEDEATFWNVPYDLGSVMHYGPTMVVVSILTDANCP